MEYWMIRYVCQQMPDRDGCQIGVETWWSQIAHLIFSNDAAQKICKGMNSECTISKYVYRVFYFVYLFYTLQKYTVFDEQNAQMQFVCG